MEREMGEKDMHNINKRVKRAVPCRAVPQNNCSKVKTSKSQMNKWIVDEWEPHLFSI